MMSHAVLFPTSLWDLANKATKMQQDFSEQVKSLSTEELRARVSRYDDWQPDYIQLVKAELASRNIGEVESLVSHRQKVLRQEDSKEIRIPGFYFVVSYLLLLPIILSPIVPRELFIGKVIALAILFVIVLSFHRKKEVEGIGNIHKYRKGQRIHFIYLIAVGITSFFLRIAFSA